MDFTSTWTSINFNKKSFEDIDKKRHLFDGSDCGSKQLQSPLLCHKSHQGNPVFVCGKISRLIPDQVPPEWVNVNLPKTFSHSNGSENILPFSTHSVGLATFLKGSAEVPQSSLHVGRAKADDSCYCTQLRQRNFYFQHTVLGHQGVNPS